VMNAAIANPMAPRKNARLFIVRLSDPTFVLQRLVRISEPTSDRD
jgi:hypothetical protein